MTSTTTACNFLVTVHARKRAELTYIISAATTGGEIFDKVATSLELCETYYFGLHYEHPVHGPSWVFNMDKPLLKQMTDKKKVANKAEDLCELHLHLLVQYYPPDISCLMHEITIKLFYTEIKDKISKNILLVAVEKRLKLTSLTALIEFGAFEEHKARKVRSLVMLGEAAGGGGGGGGGGDDDDDEDRKEEVQRQHIESVTQHWREMSKKASMSNADQVDAMRQYLKEATQLSLFGMSYFEVVDRAKTRLWLGLGAEQVVVTPRENMVEVKHAHAWDNVKVSGGGKAVVNKAKGDTFKYNVEGSEHVRKQVAKYVGGYKQLLKMHEQHELAKPGNKIVAARHQIKQLEEAARRQQFIRAETVKAQAEQSRAKARKRAQAFSVLVDVQ